MSLGQNELKDPVSGDSFKVSPEKWRASHPLAFVTDQNASRDGFVYGDSPNPWLSPRVWGRKTRSLLRKGDTSFLGDLANRGPEFGALAYGVPSALVGYGTGKLLEMIRGGEGTGLKLGLMGLLAGAGLGAYSGHLRKNAGYREPGGPQGPTQQLLNMLKGDSSVDFNTKALLMREIQKLPAHRAGELLRIVATVGAGAVAATLAKLLLGRGFLTSSLIGLGTSNFVNQLTQPRDSLGRRSYSGYTMFGDPI